MAKLPSKIVRKRPSQDRSRDTVAIIVEAAAEVLETAGFAGYNTNAVAERAGVSVGSVYQYFRNKDALTIVLIERETGILLRDVEMAARSGDRYEVVTGIVRACVLHQLRRPALARLLDFEEARLPIQEQNRSVTNRMKQAFIASVASFPAAELYGAELVASDVVAMIGGLADAAGERGETDMPRLHARIERAVLGYLESRPGSDP